MLEIPTEKEYRLKRMIQLPTEDEYKLTLVLKNKRGNPRKADSRYRFNGKK